MMSMMVSRLITNINKFSEATILSMKNRKKTRPRPKSIWRVMTWSQVTHSSSSSLLVSMM